MTMGSKDFSKYEIVFDNDRNTFALGDVVRGKIVLELEKDISVKGIVAKFKGIADATIFVGDYDSQKETYYNHGSLLLGTYPNTPTMDEVNIPAGHHEYPFGFRLPPSMPYTFSCDGDERGLVEHVVTGNVYKGKKTSYLVQRHFTVLGALDLNTVDDAREEVWQCGSRPLSCLALRFGTIKATFSLGKKGYVPGETVHIYASIQNESSVRVKNTHVALMQMITLTVHGSTAVRRKKMCHVRRGPIPAGGSYEWDGEPMVLPRDLEPSNMVGCKLIDVNYMVKLVVVPARCYKRLVLPADVIIGTVPMEDDSHQMDTVRRRSPRVSDVYDFGTYL